MNLNRIFDSLVSSGVAGGLAGGAASALLVQGLGSKKGRKTLGKAAKLGGAAVVGGLAWKAYENYRAGRGQQDAAPPAEAGDAGAWQGIRESEFLPEASLPAARRDLLILRAMITAAHADGHIDMDERLEIYQRIEGMTLSHAEKGLLMEELSMPMTMEQLVQQVPNRARAAEVYLAALLMTDSPSPAHRLFRYDLAEQLALPAGFVRALHDEVRAGDDDSAPALTRDERPANESPRVSPQA